MRNYYDQELVAYLKEIGIQNFRIISQPNNIVEIMNKNFFFNTRRDFTSFKNGRRIQSSWEHLPIDSVNFVKQLIQEGLCGESEKLFFIGDNTEDDYEFCLSDLLIILPYLVENIPQNHCFLLEGENRLIFITEDDELQFGML